MIVDTNVILHLLNEDHPLSAEVTRAFASLSAVQSARTNEIVFAEISASYGSARAVSSQLASLSITVDRLSLEDCYRAGVAFREYRRRGAPRTAILPDFLIGAQAAVRGWPILTRDPRRFSSYFPEVELIDPLEEYDAQH
jgi:hypothetical protein